MKVQLHHVLIIVLTSAMIMSCKKKDNDDPVAPILTFGSISRTEVNQFTDTLTITFAYEDHQGDLGESDPDVYSLRIKDDRLSGYDWYHIPPMAPGSNVIHIRGNYSVEIPPLFLLGNGNEESTRFTLQIRDRAGNWSNSILTPAVLITE